MKISEPRDDTDLMTPLPASHASEEELFMASTIVAMTKTQEAIISKMGEIQDTLKTILEELRRGQTQAQTVMSVLQKCHEDELERMMKLVSLCCEQKRQPEQNTAPASHHTTGATMGTPTAAAVQRGLLPSMAAFESASTPNSFFGPAPPSLTDMTPAQYLYLQQHLAAQQQQRIIAQQQGLGYGHPAADASFTTPSKAVPTPTCGGLYAPALSSGLPIFQQMTAPVQTNRMMAPQMAQMPQGQQYGAQQQQIQFGAFGMGTANKTGQYTQSPLAAGSGLASGTPPIFTQQKMEVKPALDMTTPKSPQPQAVTTPTIKTEPSKQSEAASKPFSFSVPPAAVPKTQAPVVSKLAAPSGGFTFGMTTTTQSPVIGGGVKVQETKTEGDKTVKEGEDEEGPEPFEPSAHFEPVIPLPDLVEVTTGEENEKVELSERCKLYRYASQTNEWKERGVGELKILKDPKSGTCRIVMRREQIHKVCANHKIISSMSLTQMQKSDRAYAWHAQDFSEGDMNEEKLAARFKTADAAKKFYETFNKAKESAVNSPVKTGAPPKQEQKPAALVEEAPKKTEKDSKPAAKVEKTPKGFGDAFKPKTGSKPMSTVVPLKGSSGTQFSFGFTATASPSSTVSTPPQQPTPAAGSDKSAVAPMFGISAKPKDSVKETPATPTTTPVSGIATTTPPLFGFADKFKPHVPAVSSSPNFNLFATLSAKTTPAPITNARAFSLGVQSPKQTTTPVTTKEQSHQAVTTTTNATETQPSAVPSFSFKFNSGGTATSQPTATGLMFGAAPVFGSKMVVQTDATKPTNGSPAEKPKSSTFGGGSALFVDSSSVFGGRLSGNASGGFGALTAKAPSETKKDTVGTKPSTIAPFGGGKFGAAGSSICSTLKNEKDKSAEKQPGATTKGNHSDGEEEFVPTAVFEQVIPTPAWVRVQTGEENEKVLFKSRAKLYRFIEETKEYKERGVGDIKILLNESTGHSRVVMRREQVLKVCANMPLMHEMSVKKTSATENACIWVCKDYAEDPNGVMECFVVRFKEIATADDFVETFNNACKGKLESNTITLQHAEEPKSRGEYGEDEDYDVEDPYEEIGDFPARMTIHESCASPLKPAKSSVVEGSYSIGMQYDMNAMRIDLCDSEGVVHLTHFIMSDTKTQAVGYMSMKYMAADVKSKNKTIEVLFEKGVDRDQALKHIAEGVRIAVQAEDED